MGELLSGLFAKANLKKSMIAQLFPIPLHHQSSIITLHRRNGFEPKGKSDYSERPRQDGGDSILQL